jgi:Holliday junction resolvasome RuvABC endonuclease subunit
MNNHLKILSIDPGNNLGFSLYTLNGYNLNITNIETGLMVLDKNINNDNKDIMLYRTNVLSKFIYNIVNIEQPHILSLETAFLNSKFPKAVMQLSQYLITIQSIVYNINPFIKVFKYPPKYIKNIVYGKGGANKEDMYNSVKNIKEINKHINCTNLSEHEIDSLAIGYTSILEIRKYPYIIYSI